MSENRMTTGVCRSRAFSPCTTSYKSISRAGSMLGLTTTWPAALMEKYPFPPRFYLVKIQGLAGLPRVIRR